ncbi:hypothetical protein D3C86_1925110 [compost metagenome]
MLRKLGTFMQRARQIGQRRGHNQRDLAWLLLQLADNEVFCPLCFRLLRYPHIAQCAADTI